LPVLAYYSTARLWKEGRENKRENIKFDKSEKTSRTFPSRYRGYRDALEIKSTFKIMLEWFKGKFSDLKVNDESSPQLDCVRNVILENIPGARSLKWVFNPDRIQTLYIVFNNGDETPFHFLSDGYRNLLAIFADLAYRCVTLNPHFGKEANLQTNGMVLIDELDLHLHPSWQQEVVANLKKTFPLIQFVASTHSPFIIQEMEDEEVIKLNVRADELRAVKLKGMNRLGVEDIAEDIQDVDTPNMSSKREEMFELAEKYYRLLDQSEENKNIEELQRLKDQLNTIEEMYSDDVAYYAFLKQERLSRGIQ
jgi:predicted ATP-binding protein involved in virulence